jgi:GTP-binding protein
VVVALNKVDTIDAELVEALSEELAEESGLPIMALSAAANMGLEAVLDALLEKLSPEAAGIHTDVAESEDEQPWSPL